VIFSEQNQLVFYVFMVQKTCHFLLHEKTFIRERLFELT